MVKMGLELISSHGRVRGGVKVGLRGASRSPVRAAMPCSMTSNDRSTLQGNIYGYVTWAYDHIWV